MSLDIFLLLGAERPGQSHLQALGEADHAGERCAHLVGDVGEEHVLQPVGGFQRIGAVAQRAFDAHRIRDVGEGEQRVAVGQRHGGILQRALIGGELAVDRACAALRAW